MHWLSKITIASTLSIFAAAVAACSATTAPASGVDDTQAANVASQVSSDPNCYHRQNLRPVHVLTTCSGEEKNGALCYPYCNPGFHGAGPYCWQDCPAGYTDDGATCRRDAHIISANNSHCPWYDKCGLTLSKGCSICPPGYSNDGCTCRQDVSIFAKSSYYRGLGSSMGCEAGQDQIGGLCYSACPSGWTPNGIHCDEIKETCSDPGTGQNTCPGGGQPQGFAFCLENPSEQIEHQCGDMQEVDLTDCSEDAAEQRAHATATNWKITKGQCPPCQFPIQ